MSGIPSTAFIHVSIMVLKNSEKQTCTLLDGHSSKTHAHVDWLWMIRKSASDCKCWHMVPTMKYCASKCEPEKTLPSLRCLLSGIWSQQQESNDYRPKEVIPSRGRRVSLADRATAVLSSHWSVTWGQGIGSGRETELKVSSWLPRVLLSHYWDIQSINGKTATSHFEGQLW